MVGTTSLKKLQDYSLPNPKTLSHGLGVWGGHNERENQLMLNFVLCDCQSFYAQAQNRLFWWVSLTNKQKDDPRCCIMWHVTCTVLITKVELSLNIFPPL